MGFSVGRASNYTDAFHRFADQPTDYNYANKKTSNQGYVKGPNGEDIDWSYEYDSDYARMEGEEGVLVYIFDPDTEDVLDSLGGVSVESLQVSDHGNTNVSPEDEAYLKSVAQELADELPRTSNKIGAALTNHPDYSPDGWTEDEADYMASKKATAPTVVVVDTSDGMVFNKDSSGHLFTMETAQAFALRRNMELNESMPKYEVHTLSKTANDMVVKCPKCKSRWDYEESPTCEGCGMHWEELFVKGAAITPHPEYSPEAWTTPEVKKDIEALTYTSPEQAVKAILAVLDDHGYDSIDREMAFYDAADKLKVDYEELYQAWLNNPTASKTAEKTVCLNCGSSNLSDNGGNKKCDDCGNEFPDPKVETASKVADRGAQVRPVDPTSLKEVPNCFAGGCGGTVAFEAWSSGDDEHIYACRAHVGDAAGNLAKQGSKVASSKSARDVRTGDTIIVPALAYSPTNIQPGSTVKVTGTSQDSGAIFIFVNRTTGDQDPPADLVFNHGDPVEVL